MSGTTQLHFTREDLHSFNTLDIMAIHFTRLVLESSRLDPDSASGAGPENEPTLLFPFRASGAETRLDAYRGSR